MCDLEERCMVVPATSQEGERRTSECSLAREPLTSQVGKRLSELDSMAPSAIVDRSGAALDSRRKGTALDQA